jgi:hypothetical protein
VIVDRTSHAPGRYRLRDRAPSEVDLVVLHQTGTQQDLPQSTLDKTRAHALILDDGTVLRLHPWTARLRYGSGPWNARCITIEHRANLPGRYVKGQGRWWRPAPPKNFEGTPAAWRARCDAELSPDTWDADARRAQVLASRALLRQLRDELPALKFIGAHRQVQAGKGGCPGPDLWREVGEWAIRELGFELVEVAPTGSPLPPNWRQAPTIRDVVEPATRLYDGPVAADSP